MYYILAKTASLFTSLKHLKLKPKRLGIFSFILIAVFVLVFWLYLTDPTNAQVSLISWEWGKDKVLNLIAGILLILASFFMKLAIWMLAFIIELGGYNGFIDSSAVEVGWVMVRDIANMFFVVILLVIAFGTILGIEQYEWKKLLIKFMLAAILVNFSRVICGLIIDASQVVMLTFINGVAATAGGNLINMFNWNDIQSLSENTSGIEPNNVFMAAVGGLIFAAMGMAVIAVYLIILLARLVVLWVLIVLSPLAFVLSVIPQTQKYAQQWWLKFGGQVIIGPVLAFFLWLSFVTLTSNSEGIHAHVAEESQKSIASKTTEISDGSTAGEYDVETAGVTKAMTWDKMASFAIAIAMLIVGAKAAQETGAVGGGIMSGAIDFGKKVAMVASGVAAGMYLAKGAGNLGLKGIKGAAYRAPVIGGKKWELRGKREWEGIKNWYYGKGIEPTGKGKVAQDELSKLEDSYGIEDAKKRDALLKEKGIKGTELKKITDEENRLKEEGKGGQLSVTEAKQKASLEGQLEGIQNLLGDEAIEKNEVKRGELKQKMEELGEVVEKSRGRGVVGWLASRGMALEKTVGKTEKMAKTREDILWKRTGSEAGGVLFSRRGNMRDSQDRIERGWLKAEEARSKAKDEEGENIGEYETLRRPRYKGGKFEDSKGTMAERIDQRKTMAEMYKAKIENLEAEAKLKLVLNPRENAPMEGIDGRMFNYDRAVKEQALAKISKDTLSAGEETALNDRVSVEMLVASIINQTASKVELGLAGSEEEEQIKEKDGELGEQERKAKFIIDKRNEKIAKKRSILKTNEGYKEEIEALGEDGVLTEEDSNYKDKLLSRIDTGDARVKIIDAILNGDEGVESILDYKDVKTEKESKTKIDGVALLEINKSVAKKKDELKKMQEQFGVQADFIRNGNTEASQELIDNLAGQIKALTTDAKKPTTTDTDKAKKLARIKEKNDLMEELIYAKTRMGKGGTSAWQYGTVVARQQEASRGYRYRHNTMLSTAEQLEIHNKRGLKAPDNALAELVEEYEKSFRDISYGDFVNTVGTTFGTMVQKIQDGVKNKLKPHEVLTDGDRASMMGLFKKGFDKSWVDDIILSIMGNEETKRTLGEALGWTDMDFDSDRIGEVVTLAATGDLKFTKQSMVMRELRDEGIYSKDIKLRMSAAAINDGMKTGNFVNLEGETLTRDQLVGKDGKGGVKENILKHLRKHGRSFTKEQQDMFDAIFEVDDESRKKTKILIGEYLETAKANQPALQFMANLRDPAMKNGHAENSERALITDIGKGELIYMPSGGREARDSVHGDVRKMETNDRGGNQSHQYFDLAVIDEFGQFMKAVKAIEYVSTRGDITTSAAFSKTPIRTKLNAIGLGSHETASKTMGPEGQRIADSVGRKIKTQRDYQHLIDELMEDEKIHLSLEEATRFVGAREMALNDWSIMIKENVRDFAMLLGSTSDVNSSDASLKGKMNFQMPTIGKDGRLKNIHIQNVNQIIELMKGNEEDLDGREFGGSLGIRVKGLEKFVPSITEKTDEKTARQMNSPESGGTGDSAG